MLSGYEPTLALHREGAPSALNSKLCLSKQLGGLHALLQKGAYVGYRQHHTRSKGVVIYAPNMCLGS